jgi:hypothetical protein
MSELAIYRLHRYSAAEVSIISPFAKGSRNDFVLDFGAKAKDLD